MTVHAVVHVRAGSARTAPTLPVAYSVLLAVLVVTAAGYGFLVDDAYRVPVLLDVMWHGQGLVDLMLAPLLVWSAWRARRGSFGAHLGWLALMFWLAYVCAHYAIGVPYNEMFLVYVGSFSLAGYGLLDGLLRVDVRSVAPAFEGTPRRATAWFLLLGALAFGGLWLAEIVVAFPDGQPAGNLVYDLPSPTYVLDLGWVIPFVVAAAWLSLCGHAVGPVLSAVALLWLVLLCLAMLAMVPFQIRENEPIDIPYTVIFSVLGSVTTGFVVAGARRMSSVADGWLRPGLWG